MRCLDKQTRIARFTFASLLRRKSKNISLIAVYAFVVFLLASVTFFTHSIKKEAIGVMKNAPEMTVQRLTAGRHDLIPIDYMDPLRQIRGVKSVKSRLWGYYSDSRSGAHYTLIANQDRPPQDGTILIGREILRHLPSGPNNTMAFKTYDGSYIFLRIMGTYPSGSKLVSSDLIVISENDFRKLFALPKGYATDLILEVRNSKELPTIAEKIVRLFPDTRPILREEMLRTYDAVFDWRGGILIVILLASVFAFIIFAWDKAAGLSAEERREIGILKGVGWETSDILLMKFWEGAAISLVSFSLGVLSACFHVFFTSSALFESALKGWSVLYPRFRLAPSIDAYQVATLFFLTVVPYTVATLIPSWKAATVDPDAIMRT